MSIMCHTLWTVGQNGTAFQVWSLDKFHRLFWKHAENIDSRMGWRHCTNIIPLGSKNACVGIYLTKLLVYSQIIRVRIIHVVAIGCTGYTVKIIFKTRNFFICSRIPHLSTCQLCGWKMHGDQCWWLIFGCESDWYVRCCKKLDRHNGWKLSNDGPSLNMHNPCVRGDDDGLLRAHSQWR